MPTPSTATPRDIPSPMRRAPVPRVLLAIVALVAWASGAREAGAQLPPDARWHTIESANFRVTFTEGLEPVARDAVDAAERARTLIARFLTSPPSGRVDIILSDNVDYTNGSATPFPSNRITIYAKPPVDAPGLDYYRDWIDLVVLHELTHIFQIDQTGSVGSALRSVFGRLPLTWPLFPALTTPGWSIEGLGVDVESRFTGFGRTNGSFHEMVVRTATLEDEIDRMDRLNEGSAIWPGGQRAYIYGSLFFDWLEEQHGDDLQRRLLDHTTSAVLPPFLFFDRIARHTFGSSFDRAYAQWRKELLVRYTALRDSLTAAGLTETETMTDRGYIAEHPRVSPDGSRVAFAAADGTNLTATRIIDARTGDVIENHRRNGTGGHAWLPGGRSLVVSQFEYDGPYRIYGDLYVVGRESERVTFNARLQDPDVTRDGQRAVAVQNEGGTNRLVSVNLASGVITPITSYDPGVNWAFPRWSPDGTRIAAGRWSEGGDYDVVVVDPDGRTLIDVTADRAVDTAPAWSPDGRWLLYQSDRSGITNLYAADLTGDAPRNRQVTSLLTGAFQPDVSPDGGTIWFAEYHHDGYRIARMPFDPSAWREPAPLVLPDPTVGKAATAPGRASSSDATLPVRPYSPFPSVLPTYWAPVIIDQNIIGTSWGVSIEGRDLVGRNAFGAWAAVQPKSGRLQGAFAWSWAGLGTPILQLEAARDWDAAALPDTIDGWLFERDDVVALVATFLRRRWRHSASLSIGLEREVLTRSLEDAPANVRLTDPRDELYNLIGRVGFANYQVQPFSISREDGISISLAGRNEIERNAAASRDQSVRELRALATAYRSIDLGAFAHHVLALRGSTLLRDGDGATPTSIGGSSGGIVGAFGFSAGGNSRLLPVRGFESGVRAGTRAWTASAEYRLPIALVGRRPAVSPFYIDRISATAFFDAGDAWCTGLADQLFGSCQRARGQPPLLSAGAELAIDMSFARIVATRVRAGIGFPIQGPTTSPRFYLQAGQSF